MKLTASQLRQIIQEELQGAINETADTAGEEVVEFVDNFYNHEALMLRPHHTYRSDNNSINVNYSGDYTDASFNVAQDEDGQVYATILSDPEEKKHRSVEATVDAVNIKIDEKKWKP